MTFVINLLNHPLVLYLRGQTSYPITVDDCLPHTHLSPSIPTKAWRENHQGSLLVPSCCIAHCLPVHHEGGHPSKSLPCLRYKPVTNISSKLLKIYQFFVMPRINTASPLNMLYSHLLLLCSVFLKILGHQSHDRWNAPLLRRGTPWLLWSGCSPRATGTQGGTQWWTGSSALHLYRTLSQLPYQCMK